MKKFILALSLVISSVSFAADCSQEAVKIAQANLDQVAHSYGFNYSDIAPDATDTPAKTITDKNGETLSVHTLNGSIYKAGYTVTVTLDSLCALRTLSIHDDSTL